LEQEKESVNGIEKILLNSRRFWMMKPGRTSSNHVISLGRLSNMSFGFAGYDNS
jgi:hypothetical protein